MEGRKTERINLSCALLDRKRKRETEKDRERERKRVRETEDEEEDDEGVEENKGNVARGRSQRESREVPESCRQALPLIMRQGERR